MKIKIEQTLHGYQTGHQLLMASSQLTSEAKKTLLVQSDLSGSNIDQDFKVYISGYPISNFYAFSKTWYADEMRRPGCVWTHTLLISFSDLGKIPDLDQLISFFKRPVINEYESYSTPLFLEKENLKNSSTSFTNFQVIRPILKALYTYHSKTILYPSYNSSDLEIDIVQLWSNQWPRLRRNFSFCTGALSLKSINGVEFDLQIVPTRNINSVEKQSTNAHIVDNLSDYEQSWLNVIKDSKKNKLRKFLWIYGSDLKGSRKNYIPLIELYGESEKEKSEFTTTMNLISKAFTIEEASTLKNDIYTNKLFNFNEKDVLNFLVSSESLGQQNGFAQEKILSALSAGKININDVLELYRAAIPNRIDEQVFKNISVGNTEMLDLIRKDEEFVEIFFDHIPNLSILNETWNLPYERQLKIIEILELSARVHWEAVIEKIYKSGSEIIFHTLRTGNPNKLKYFFRAFNVENTPYNSNLFLLFDRNRATLKDYVKSNYKELNSNFCTAIFVVSDYNDIYNYKIDSGIWRTIYQKIEHESVKIYASCTLLALSFRRETTQPPALIEVCFKDVYYFAKESKIDNSNWRIIPHDLSDLEEDDDIITAFFKYFLPSTAKHNDVPSWDYCQILIRTLVNKFVKNNWSPHYFLATLTTFEITQNAIGYAVSFKKGQKYLREVVSRIKQKKLDVPAHQTEIIKILKKEFL